MMITEINMQMNVRVWIFLQFLFQPLCEPTKPVPTKDEWKMKFLLEERIERLEKNEKWKKIK